MREPSLRAFPMSRVYGHKRGRLEFVALSFEKEKLNWLIASSGPPRAKNLTHYMTIFLFPLWPVIRLVDHIPSCYKLKAHPVLSMLHESSICDDPTEVRNAERLASYLMISHNDSALCLVIFLSRHVERIREGKAERSTFHEGVCVRTGNEFRKLMPLQDTGDPMACGGPPTLQQ